MGDHLQIQARDWSYNCCFCNDRYVSISWYYSTMSAYNKTGNEGMNWILYYTSDKVFLSDDSTCASKKTRKRFSI